MRHALVPSYHFPPIGGAAVQRNIKLVRYLPRFGYLPVVVTGSGTAAGRWTPSDPTLERDIPDDVDVIRVATPEARAAGPWRERASRWLGLGKAWTDWWTQGVLGSATSVAEGIEIIYAPLVPYDSYVAAGRLKSLLGCPLVVDLHDPWALDEMMVYPTGLHRRQGLRTMGKAVRAADGIVMSTPEAKDRLLETFPELSSKAVVAISNGFDDEDFSGTPPARSDAAFRIVHTGYLHTELGWEHRRVLAMRRILGGAFAEVDILTRSHVYLLQAVERLLRSDPSLGPIEVHLAGVLTDADRTVASESSNVVLHGYLPHPQAVELMRSADMLFLPMHELRNGGRVGIIPGKTFEYLAARRPILAAIPDGDARDLLEAAGNASICRPSDVDCIAAAIAEAIARKGRGEMPRRPDEQLVRQCEWPRRAEALAELFDLVLGARQAPRAATG